MRSLPNGKPISSLGFGCSSLWAKRRFDAEIAHGILETADREGLNHFDTGPSYGDGELRLGRFLRGKDLARFVISTKVGTHRAQDGRLRKSFDVDRLAVSFQESLHRLGIDKVDILYLHGPALQDLSASVLEFMQEQKSQGRADYIGVNSFDLGVVEAVRRLPFDSVMLQYSIADLRFENLIRELRRDGKFVIAATVLGQNIFDLRTFLPTRVNSAWYLLRALKNAPTFPLKGLSLRRKIKRLGVAPQRAAIGFAVGHPLITSCLFGSTDADHVAANALAARSPMPEHDRALFG